MMMSMSYIPVEHGSGNYVLSLVRDRDITVVASASYVYSNLVRHLVETLTALVRSYGKPKQLIAGDGEAFASARFQAAVKRLGVGK